jgi:hypothetical protein
MKKDHVLMKIQRVIFLCFSFIDFVVFKKITIIDNNNNVNK